MNADEAMSADGATRADGTAAVVGNDVDADVIFPARRLAVLDPRDLTEENRP